MPTRSERMKARWADPEQAARMKAGLAKGLRTTAARLAGEEPPADPPPNPAGADDPPERRPGIFSASPRDLVDRIFGGGR